jgi:hypothetical protein
MLVLTIPDGEVIPESLKNLGPIQLRTPISGYSTLGIVEPLPPYDQISLSDLLFIERYMGARVERPFQLIALRSDIPVRQVGRMRRMYMFPPEPYCVEDIPWLKKDLDEYGGELIAYAQELPFKNKMVQFVKGYYEFFVREYKDRFESVDQIIPECQHMWLPDYTQANWYILVEYDEYKDCDMITIFVQFPNITVPTAPPS